MALIQNTARAEQDIYEAWRYIALENGHAADRFLDALERRLDQLILHPWSGRAREDLGPGVRHLNALQYAVYYRVEPDCIRVIRVMHGRRGIGIWDLVE